MSVHSIQLLWQREVAGVIAIPRHAVADSGTVAVAVPDSRHSCRLFDYGLHRLATGYTRPEPEEAGAIPFDSVRRLEFTPAPEIAIAITDKDLYLVRLAGTSAEQHPYMPGRGLLFLDASIAGNDPRRTIVLLSQDRAGGAYSVTLAEGREKMAPLWAKSWTHALTGVSISADGNWLAVGHANGRVSLLDRTRRVVWEVADPANRPIASLAVDNHGHVVSVDATGEVRRHDEEKGGVVWRSHLRDSAPSRSPASRVSFRVAADAQTQVVGIALAALVTRKADAEEEPSRYFLLDGATGDVAWEDTLYSRPTGIAVAASGEFMAVSTQTDLLFFSMDVTETETTAAPSSVAPALYEAAQVEASAGHYFTALPLLNKALAADPTAMEAATLHEDVAWQIRESVMERTTEVTEESLAMVDAALHLLPHNEKLTMRRNALARLLAAKFVDEGADREAHGQFDEAIGAYRRAITLHPNAIEARQGILKVEERQLRGVLAEAQAAISQQKWSEATQLLSKALAIRPTDENIASQLSGIQRDEAFARGTRYYNAQRYPEAAFQFKRVLALDPGHMDALLHLNQAEAQLRKRSEPEDPVAAAIEKFKRPH